MESHILVGSKVTCRVKGHLRLNLSDSNQTWVEDALWRPSHVGGVKGHLRSNVKFYLQVYKMSNNSAVISLILTKLG